MLPSLRDEYPYPQVERRRSVRYEFSIEIEIEWCGKKVSGTRAQHQPQVHRSSGPSGIKCGIHANLALNLPPKVECVVTRVVPGRESALP